MDNLLARLQELETRTRKVEGQLRRWRVGAFLLCLATVSLVYVLPGQAQFGVGGVAQQNVVSAPFIVKGSNGVKLLEINEFVDRNNTASQDALLTMYRNGQPAAMFRTTGKIYKDAYDPKENYLNVIETWLYRYPVGKNGQVEPIPYLASSTALTRGGGSIAVFNEQGNPSMTPPFAARLTAQRGAGGAVMLFDQEGNQAKTFVAK